MSKEGRRPKARLKSARPDLFTRFSEPITFEDREAAMGLTDTTKGREDSFYTYDQPQTEQPQSHQFSLHNESESPILQPANESITAILCINGEPFNASLNGRITGKV
jgi:hypothetical protein